MCLGINAQSFPYLTVGLYQTNVSSALLLNSDGTLAGINVNNFINTNTGALQGSGSGLTNYQTGGIFAVNDSQTLVTGITYLPFGVNNKTYTTTNVSTILWTATADCYLSNFYTTCVNATATNAIWLYYGRNGQVVASSLALQILPVTSGAVRTNDTTHVVSYAKGDTGFLVASNTSGSSTFPILTYNVGVFANP